ncbi:MAG: uracil-DNA glycosylase [Synergistaceae bacterium]|nr:uracil-DNA glycosylase [Synergistaceae bacterium]MBQ6971389.1 uracil-DNA glycosylase [Synergistaceae bacterium]
MSIDINEAWDELKRRVSECQKCGLCKKRNKTVFGEGPTDCRVVIVGEGPGADEDATGKPFVGKAGQLLTSILEDGGKIPRNTLYITNTVKCRPPENRNPTKEEAQACSEFLEAQLLLLHPDIVVTLGNIPTQFLLKTTQGITSLRGTWVNWRGIKLFPMFHPSYLLRNESRAPGSPKYLTWQDVKALKAEIDKLQGADTL